MEYRRRRRRRRSSGARYTGYSRGRSARGMGSGGLGSAFLILLLTAGLIYILLATPVGTWIAGHIFAPLFSKDGGLTEDSPSPVPGISQSASPVPAEKTTETMTLPRLEMYALQMGVFSSAEHAQGLISSLRSLGAAGFEFSDGENVRIFASAYNTEAAADSVCERLKNQGYDCTVYPLSGNALELTVTADAEKIANIRTAVEFAHSIIDDINDEVIGFDSEERSVDYGKAIGNEMLANVKNIRASVSNISDESGLIAALDDYYTKVAGALTDFVSTDTDNRVEMSGRLKYLQSQAAACYLSLLGKLAV